MLTTALGSKGTREDASGHRVRAGGAPGPDQLFQKQEGLEEPGPVGRRLSTSNSLLCLLSANRSKGKKSQLNPRWLVAWGGGSGHT